MFGALSHFLCKNEPLSLVVVSLKLTSFPRRKTLPSSQGNIFITLSLKKSLTKYFPLFFTHLEYPLSYHQAMLKKSPGLSPWCRALSAIPCGSGESRGTLCHVCQRTLPTSCTMDRAKEEASHPQGQRLPTG